MKLEVIVPNESCPNPKLLNNTRLADPESYEDVRNLIVGQDNKITKKIGHLLYGDDSVDNVLTWKDKYQNCTL